jgi:hypothetical protein
MFSTIGRSRLGPLGRGGSCQVETSLKLYLESLLRLVRDGIINRFYQHITRCYEHL